MGGVGVVMICFSLGVVISHPFRVRRRKGWGTSGVVRVIVIAVRMCVLVAVRRVLVIVRIFVLRSGLFGRDHVYFGCGKAAAHHLAHLQPRAYIQRGGRFFQHPKRHTGIDQRAQKHVAADAGKAFQIANTHRSVILNCRVAGIHFGVQSGIYAPRRASTSAGRMALSDPERKPAQSRVTYWKPAWRNAASMASSMSMASARGNS